MTQSHSDQYLSVLSPRDVKFDAHKVTSEQVAELYGLDGNQGYTGFISGNRVVNFRSYTTKIQLCGSWLKFVKLKDGKIKLIDARFCKSPNCPMCQWRRQLVWRAKFLAVAPAIRESYPSHRWVFLTLTLRNCELGNLRATVKHMSESFKRLRALADFPLKGWVRSLEVTRAWDWYDRNNNYLGRHGVKWYYESKDHDKLAWTVKPTDEVHPHYHLLALVPASYFSTGYVTQARWSEMWGASLRVSYTPIVHIQTVKAKKGAKLLPDLEVVEGELDKAVSPTEITDDSGLFKGICETMKYTVKEQDLLGSFCTDVDINSDWLKGLTEQLYKMRRIEYSGILKEFGKEVDKAEGEDGNLISGGETSEGKDEIEKEIVFRWERVINRYVSNG